MKIIRKFFIIVLLLIGAATTLLFYASYGYLNRQIEWVLTIYFESKRENVKLQGLNVKGNEINLKNAQVLLSDNARAEINNLNVKFIFNNLLTSPKLIAIVQTEKVLIKNNLEQIVTQATFTANYRMNFMSGTVEGEVRLEDIENYNLLMEKPGLGKGFCNYEKGFFKEKNISCHLHLSDTSNSIIDAKVKDDEIKLKGTFNNIPIALYKPFEKIIPQSKLLEFLNGFIYAGYIKSGEIKVNLNKNYYKTNILRKENLSGNFAIHDLEFKYEKDFPSLKNVEMDVDIVGANTQIALKKAYSGSTLISNGIINLNLASEYPTVVATGNGKGPAVDLIDFIPLHSLEKLKKNDIDLKKLTGTVNTKIELTIPLAPHIPNSYNIISDISNAGLKIFNNNLELKKAKISGGFDGNRVFLSGAGKINDFESNLSYYFNLNNEEDYDHLLKIKSKIKAQNQKIGLIKVLAGSGLFDFEYKIKGDKATVNANTDLTKTEFYIDKIAIHKLKGDRANLVMQGDFDDYPDINLGFKLTGDNSLKIIGALSVKNGFYKLDLPYINHKDTSVKGEISFDKDNFNAKIEGPKLDLSAANMMQFLEKDKESTNSELKVKVEKVRLKNDIYLDNLFLTIKCNKTRCYKGYLDSKIGSRFFKMLLKTFADKEEWVITSTNAGALFRGFGLYNDMKTGAMLVILNTKRQEVKKGEIIPILDGTFTFRNFVVVDTPFLTRLVSFVSLPGLTNLVTNNKDVIFKIMNGKFAYDKDTITITESSAEGPFFDFTLVGKINTKARKIDIKGNVIPSMYGLSTILKNIPVLGKVFSGGHRKGLIFAPYSVYQSY